MYQLLIAGSNQIHPQCFVFIFFKTFWEYKTLIKYPDINPDNIRIDLFLDSDSFYNCIPHLNVQTTVIIIY